MKRQKVYKIATSQPVDFWYTAQDALEAARSMGHDGQDPQTKTELLFMRAALLMLIGPEELCKDPVVIWIPDGNYLATTLMAKTVDNGMTFWMVPEDLEPLLLSQGFGDPPYATLTLDV
jgi:hypothetical protein